jgi:hypothetical protein
MGVKTQSDQALVSFLIFWTVLLIDTYYYPYMLVTSLIHFGLFTHRALDMFTLILLPFHSYIQVQECSYHVFIDCVGQTVLGLSVYGQNKDHALLQINITAGLEYIC